MGSAGLVQFYLATYLPMTLLGFLILAVLRSQGIGENLKDLTGLARRSPAIAFTMTVALASMAGLPLTAGFMAKMFVFIAAVEQGYYGVVVVAIIGAAAGFYYYFRPILAMYSSGENDASKLTWTPLARLTAVLLMIGVIVLGVYPKALQSTLQPVVELKK
jgi:NADH-quinone oxidoreductase subunit N